MNRLDTLHNQLEDLIDLVKFIRKGVAAESVAAESVGVPNLRLKDADAIESLAKTAADTLREYLWNGR
jgi:hypothetical protein